jgi:class 3 adenylate cyclase
MTMDRVVCPSCGADNRPDRRFCRSCGTALAPSCPVCGAAADPGDRFCGECGATIGEPAPPGDARERTPSDGPQLERRLVSVLFADVVGSTSVAEGADMEAVREMLGRYYDLCREVVERYAGTIEKFIGDAVMAVWGTPLAHEDDAARAVRAALDLVDAARSIRTPAGDPLVLRAGVLTGEAAATLGGSGDSLVAGDLVNTAARLQSVATPGTVLVGESTMRATGDAIQYEAAGQHAVKGRVAPVTAWRALRVGAGQIGEHRGAVLEAPFVGRDDELRLVKEVLHQTARERRPRLISVTGVAGIGKTRLTWELEKYCDALVETVYWHEGRSPAYGEGLAFWALAEMVRQRARIAESDDAATARRRLAEMVAEYLPDDEERNRVEPRLAALLGLESAPAGSTEELTAAWRTLFERIADRGTTVLVFEDLHWADPGLLDFIEALLGGTRARAILVIALTRPELIETRPTWGATVRNHLRLDLAPLDADAMELLLVGLAPGIPPEAIASISRRAAGIPLYAVETVRMLLDSGRLAEHGGRFRLDGELGDIAVPDSLTSLLGARLDALEPDVRDLVGHAAVLGISFDASDLATVSGRRETDVRRTLDQLARRELLTLDEDPRSPERGQYRFLQGLLREVAYGRLSRKERQARHLAAAELFAATAAADLAGVTATHYLEAVRAASDEDRDALRARALAALEEAADRSRAIGAHASAARYLGDALELAADDHDALRLREARVAELATTDSRELDQEAAALLALGRERRDPGLQARAAFWLAGFTLTEGHPADAVRLLGEVRDELGPFVAEEADGVRLLAELGRCQLMAGEQQAALPIIDEALVVAQRLGLTEIVGDLLASKGWALGANNRPIEATVTLRGAVWYAEREGLWRPEFRSRMNLSAWVQMDDNRECFAVTREGLERAQRIGLETWVYPLANNAMYAALELGEWDWLDATAAELRTDDQVVPWRASAINVLRSLAALRGDASRAAALKERSDSMTRGHDDPQLRVADLIGDVWVAYAGGDLDAATRAMDTVLVLWDAVRAEDRIKQTLVGIAVRDPERLAWQSVAAGRAEVAVQAAAAAAAALILGDASQVVALDAAIDDLDAAGHRLSAAVLRRERVRLSPDDPGALVAARSAEAWLRAVGAVAMLPDLQAFLATVDDPGAVVPQETAPA